MITITKNLIIGSIIIIINVIPIITKKYKLLPVTSAISLLLALTSQYIP